MEPNTRARLEDKVLYVTCLDLCFKIKSEGWEDVPDFKSSQEEADTRVLLHALHAAEEGLRAVVISAEDTDILILCISHSRNIPSSLYQKCGTRNRIR